MTKETLLLILLFMSLIAIAGDVVTRKKVSLIFDMFVFACLSFAFAGYYAVAAVLLPMVVVGCVYQARLIWRKLKGNA